MPGILKKTKGSKSGNKVRFNQDVKDWDGLSPENKSWFNFIDLVHNLNISPNEAWDRVPKKHDRHVWEIIKYTVDRLEKRNRAYSMPMGSRKKITMFSIKSNDKTMQDLMYFVYNYYYERQLELSIKKKRENLIKYYCLGKFCKKPRKPRKLKNEENKEKQEKRENEENQEWDKLKQMFNCEKDRQITEK